jgi:hypothetical protein
MDGGSKLTSTRKALCYCDLNIHMEDIDDIREESVFHARKPQKQRYRPNT